MAHPSAPPFLVLHALRLKGLAETDVIRSWTGLADDEVPALCKELAADDLVQRRDGKAAGWSLTPDGRARHAVDVAAELDASGGRLVVDGAYRRFLSANADMLRTCTAWQLRDVGGAQVRNDHTDAGWDATVLERLQGLDTKIRPVLDDLVGCLDRFGRYRQRFVAALSKVRAGKLEWFTKPVIDSYHTVWFELHEDMLCTLGVTRSSEGGH